MTPWPGWMRISAGIPTGVVIMLLLLFYCFLWVLISLFFFIVWLFLIINRALYSCHYETLYCWVEFQRNKLRLPKTKRQKEEFVRWLALARICCTELAVSFDSVNCPNRQHSSKYQNGKLSIWNIWNQSGLWLHWSPHLQTASVGTDVPVGEHVHKLHQARHHSVQAVPCVTDNS